MTTEELRQLIEIDHAAMAFAESEAFQWCANRCNEIYPLVIILKSLGHDADAIRRCIAAADLRPDITHLEVAEAMSAQRVT